MTREVAHGKTTMARAIFLPRNFWFSTMPSANPMTVDSPTTDSTHQKVLIITVLKAGRPIASLKF